MASSTEAPQRSTADLIYDAFFSGAIGGSVVALFFLFVDLARAEPLFTPSLMGSVLFLNMAATDVVDVSLNAVAYFSAVHFAACIVLGTMVTWLVHEVELHSTHPVALLLVLFAVIEVLFLLTVSLVMPGVVEQLGVVRVGFANLLAASAMSLFFVLSHREKAWEKMKHAAHLA